MAIYNNNNGTLTTLASGARVWIGTEAAFNTAKNSIPNNTAIYITDDGDTSPTKELLFSRNPSSGTSYSDETLTLSKSANDYLVLYVTFIAHNESGTLWEYTKVVPNSCNSEELVAIDKSAFDNTSNFKEYVRLISVNDTSLVTSNGKAITNGSKSDDNYACIITRVYGIK